MKKPKYTIYFLFGTKKFPCVKVLKDKSLQKENKTYVIVPKVTELRKRVQFILSLICEINTELSIRFCDAAEMLAMNTEFRKKKYATDVLSFVPKNPYIEDNSQYLGDILICLPVCEFQARKNKTSLSTELERMIIHGITHLKGFDHERNDAAQYIMEEFEKNLRKILKRNLGDSSWCSNLT